MGFGLNVLPLVTFTLPLIPVFAALLWGFGRYDGYFKDNVIFLFFLGGIGLGALTSLLGLMVHLVSPFVFALGMPFVIELAKTAAVNRKNWRGREHAVFNGAAMGAGFALMWAFAIGYRLFSEQGVSVHLAGGIFLLATGLTFVQFLTGALVGSGVSDRTPFRALALAGLIGVLPFVALGEYLQAQALLWPILLAVAGVGAFWYARERLMILGLPPDGRKDFRRRARRARARSES